MDIEFSANAANDLIETLESATRILARHDRQLGAIEEWLYHIENNTANIGRVVNVVQKAAKAAKPSRVTPFLVGAAVGVYAYTRLKPMKFEIIKPEVKVETKPDPDNKTNLN